MGDPATPAPCPGAADADRCERRTFLVRSGEAMLGATALVGAAASVRLLYPRVSSEPPSEIALGPPSQFAVGEVVERWRKSHRMILVRTAAGFYALRAVCTHLGCAPRWSPGQGVFKCPCHGSVFTAEGHNVAGPAPRPLERLKIGLDPGGELVVDAAVAFRQERGEWRSEGAFLRYSAEAPGAEAGGAEAYGEEARGE